MLKEFKEFAVKGNMLDMAVGIIIGGAFGKVVSSLVGDVIMAPLGLILGGVDFSSLFLSFSRESFPTLADATKAGVPTLNYGNFFKAGFDFLVVAFALFLLIKQVNRFRRAEQAPAAPTTRDCPYCLSTVPLKAVKCAHCTSELKAA